MFSVCVCIIVVVRTRLSCCSCGLPWLLLLVIVEVVSVAHLFARLLHVALGLFAKVLVNGLMWVGFVCLFTCVLCKQEKSREA